MAAIAVILLRGNTGWTRIKQQGDKKQVDCGYILKVQSIKYVDGYDSGGERKRKIKDGSNGFVTVVKMALSLAELGKTTG